MEDNLPMCIRRSRLLAQNHAEREAATLEERLAKEDRFFREQLNPLVEEARETLVQTSQLETIATVTEPCPGALRLTVAEGPYAGTILFQTFRGYGKVPGVRYEIECGHRRCQGCFDVVAGAESWSHANRLLKRFIRWTYGLEEETEERKGERR
jgi:hypothetical protein